MSNSDETLEQSTKDDAILQAIADLTKRVDERINNLEKSVNIQFEAIREGIVHNSVSYDRLQATVLNLRADVKELTEEIRQVRKGNLVTLEK